MTQHEDLGAVVESAGLSHDVASVGLHARADVAVMVSGNAMAHLYLDVSSARRRSGTALRARWTAARATLLARPSVDLLLLAETTSVPSRSRSRRGGVARRSGMRARRRYSYRRDTGDPLGIGADLRRRRQHDDAYDATIDTDYPDGVVQIAHLALAPRSGDIILSAARDWDFRARYEPIPHVSSHGALHREHMLVPLLVNRPPARTPRRTVDVMPSALAALGIAIPPGLDGRSFC